jgi:integrase
MLTIGNSKKKKGIRLAIGNSKTTISMYLRTVRAAFNKVGIKDDSYPFGRGKYELPISRNIKKALTIQDISKIFKYDALEGSTRAKCRDYWLLSYLCNGANIKDLALLKYKDINDESITFIRSKTSRKISRAVVVPMTVEIGRIIDKYGNKPAFRNSYILPILSNGLDPERQRIAIDNTVRLINNEIKVIATNIGITANVTTYTARHSFATVLKRSGASMEFISESLGHHSLSTTENYLADFEMDKKREMAALLTKWNDSIEISNPPELIKENESFQESA